MGFTMKINLKKKHSDAFSYRWMNGCFETLKLVINYFLRKINLNGLIVFKKITLTGLIRWLSDKTTLKKDFVFYLNIQINVKKYLTN